jgi:methionine-R-sulfoxide reductase
MKKRTLIYTMLAVLIVVVAVAVPVIAAGTDENPDTSSTGAETVVASPFSSAATLDATITAALSIPGDWDYDPSSRYVHDERAEIPYPLALDESVWQTRLEPFEYYVLREKGTEYAFSNPMHANKQRGIYYSRATGQPLFSSDDKYDSGTGWPSFTRPINPNAIVYVGDTALFGLRIEVVDSLSGSHLGHVFPDGPAPTGQRYCINAASLVFVPEGEQPPDFIRELQALATAP